MPPNSITFQERPQCRPIPPANQRRKPHRLDAVTDPAIAARGGNARDTLTCPSQMSIGIESLRIDAGGLARLFAERFKTYADKILQAVYDEMSSSPLTARFGRQMDLAAGIMIDSTVSHLASKLPTTLRRSAAPCRLMSCNDARIS